MNDNIKILAINGTSFALSFSHIEAALKIVLLLVSIAYTGFKLFELIENRKKGR